MYFCAFLRGKDFSKFKSEFKLPSDSYFAILKIDDERYSYLIDGIDEVACEYSVIQKYVKNLNSRINK